MREQFLRTKILLGEDALQSLQDKFVVVVGLGAVGSYAVEALARLGIKRLRLVDFDTVCPTNINRQLYALHSTIGQKKHLLAKERVLDINPDCQTETLDIFADTKTFQQVFSPASDNRYPDLLIDAIDSLSAKINLLAEAYSRNIRIVSAMGAATRRDPSKIQVADISDTLSCPLAAQVRKRLKKLHIIKGIPCVFSTETPNKKAMLPLPQETDTPQVHKRPNTLGSLPTITGIIGLMTAHAGMELLLGNDPCSR